jgi:hypothetical protein
MNCIRHALRNEGERLLSMLLFEDIAISEGLRNCARILIQSMRGVPDFDLRVVVTRTYEGVSSRGISFDAMGELFYLFHFFFCVNVRFAGRVVHNGLTNTATTLHVTSTRLDSSGTASDNRRHLCMIVSQWSLSLDVLRTCIRYIPGFSVCFLCTQKLGQHKALRRVFHFIRISAWPEDFCYIYIKCQRMSKFEDLILTAFRNLFAPSDCA